MDLTLREVRVTLRGRAVLDGVSAGFRPGRITALVGPNGAGKSTLLRAAAGLIPAGGKIAIGSRPLAAMGQTERARTIGYLPQDHAVHWDLTAGELVALGRMPHRSRLAGAGPADRAAVAAALTAMDVSDFADRRITTLSGGERARVLLARVLAGEPDWLLADEPLASLDAAHQLDLLDRLRTVAAGGAGVILVLHDLAQAARVADDILVLERGRVAATALDPAVIARVFGVAARWVEVDAVPRLVTLGRA